MFAPRRRALVVAASLVALESAPALAAEGGGRPRRSDYDPGVAVGFRSGWGFPFGDRASVQGQKDSLSSNFNGMLPLWFDAGYRISKNVYVGAYFQYGFLTVPDQYCPGPQLVGCTGHDIRFGPSVHFHFVPHGALDPWVGLGFGYEAATLTIHGVEQDASRTNAGFEFVNLEGGIDIHPVFGFDWGPFVSFSMDEYRTERQSPPVGGSKTYALPSPTLHYFFVLGLRVELDF